MPTDSKSPAISENDVIRRAQRGDADAFADLFNRHKGRVYALCLRMTKNSAEAEDLTQEAFMHVFRKLAAFRLDSALSTWLYRVTINTVLMHFRRKSLRQFPVNKADSTDERGTPTPREIPSTDIRLAGCVDRVALHRALAELPNGYRQVFELHEFEGYEHREIAQFLGCSIGNSKSQLHKARLRIRELLEKPARTREDGLREIKPTAISPAWEAGLKGRLEQLPRQTPELSPILAQAA